VTGPPLEYPAVLGDIHEFKDWKIPAPGTPKTDDGLHQLGAFDAELAVEVVSANGRACENSHKAAIWVDLHKFHCPSVLVKLRKNSVPSNVFSVAPLSGHAHAVAVRFVLMNGVDRFIRVTRGG